MPDTVKGSIPHRQLLQARRPVRSNPVSVTLVPEVCDTHQRGAFCPHVWNTEEGTHCKARFSVHRTQQRHALLTAECPGTRTRISRMHEINSV